MYPARLTLIFGYDLRHDLTMVLGIIPISYAMLTTYYAFTTVLNNINGYLPLKPDSVGDPDIYLGAKLRQMKLPNGVWAWALSPSKYVHQAIRNCKTHSKENFDGRYALLKKAENPFCMSYEPELDDSTPLDPNAASYFQTIIGVMRWMVEIGRINIAMEVLLLSSHLAYPREGHLEAAYMLWLTCKPHITHD